MTTMTTNEVMKKNYICFIKEHKIFDVYMHTLRQKEIWDANKKNGCLNTNTAGVNINHVSIRLLLRRADDIFDKPIKMEIKPNLQSQMCFQNSQFLEKVYGWKQVAGFNITSCACGGNMCMEIHSVNEKDGKLVDYTKDFDDETHKWFMPLKTKNQAVILKKYMGIDAYQKISKCTCGVKWVVDEGMKQITDVSDFQGQMRQACNIVFHCID